MRNRGEALRYRQNTFGNRQEQNWRKESQQKRNSFGNMQRQNRRETPKQRKRTFGNR